MKRMLTLAVAIAAAAATLPAQAGVIDAKFSGTVSSQRNTSFALGMAIAGEFVYDTIAARYLSFTIGGQSVAQGFGSTAGITPDRYTALYQAQLSPVQQGGTLNSTFNVDLEGIAPWSTNDAIALLLNATQLASNLDTSLSNFGFLTANADGTGARSVNALLSSIQVSAVPEPTSVALLLIGIAAVGLQRGRRTKG